jgi:beta-galactosidase
MARSYSLIVAIGYALLASGPAAVLRGTAADTRSAEAIALELLPCRQQISLNHSWDFLAQDLASVEMVNRTEWPWQRIDLPHTWNAFDAVDQEPGYRRDAGWYRKDILIPFFGGNRTFRLYFEGANISTEVYVNGHRAGGHIGGYVGFVVDITPFILKGGVNHLAVRINNAIDPDIIPSQKSDFVIYGGICRDLWLQVLPAGFIDRLLISTPQVAAKSAQTTVRVRVIRSGAAGQSAALSARIKNPAGRIVAATSRSVRLMPGENEITLTFPAVRKPALWSPDQPNLHEMEVGLESDGSTDSVRGRFGYRWFEFAEQGPFFLNGKRLLLRGTHRHEEYAGYGNAVPDSLDRKDMRMIKEMGANFVRLGHYPQDPEVYRACDELGLLVWDELPWCRGGMGGAVWQSNTRRLFAEQIEQNYNHPAIIFWSIGNEMDWLPDFAGGDQPDSLRAFAAGLHEMAHRLDPGRLTAVRKFTAGPDITDVFSPSIWAGWYSGVYANYEKALTSSRSQYNRFLHVEYGGDSHAGRHTENPVDGSGLVKEDEWAEQPNMVNIARIAEQGDWSENYIVDLFDWHLMTSEHLAWLSGTAQWAFKDFATPLRPENPIPYINQKGLVDRSGRPKDSYYLFKSWWTEHPRFCYIESPTWTERVGKPGEPLPVCVFSNCSRVELRINGASLGVRTRTAGDFPASGLRWPVTFREGVNEVLAIGLDDGRETARDSLTLRYSSRKNGKPEEILLSAEKRADGCYLVTARVVDKEGQRCLDYNKRVYFSSTGSGHLKVHYGTPTGSDVIEFSNGQAAIEFIPGEGGAIIEARNQDFKGVYISLPEIAIPPDLLEIEHRRILENGRKYLDSVPVTITSVSCDRSAGTIHDYFSEGDYWWPNPDDPQGPYIRRDGLTNPDNFVAHRELLRRMSIQVAALTAAWKISGDEQYARAALQHLRAWFLEENTRMNPHLNYAQAIKGVCTGRGVGIIDTIHLLEVARSISVLGETRIMTPGEERLLTGWFSDYLTWLTTSENGIDERERKNNHGTFWVLQVAEFARLTGKTELMAYCRERYKSVLLPQQMAVDGSYPLELERTKPYGYSLFNLAGMAMLCQVLSTSEDKLWEFQLADGRGMKRALEFMLPFIADKTAWPFPPDVMYFDELPVRHPALFFAGLAWKEKACFSLWKKLAVEPRSEEGVRNYPIRQPLLWLP